MPEAVARYVLDSDTLSYMLKRNVVVIERLLREVEQKAEFYLCPVVYYEILRGLLYRDAKRQLAEFEMLAATLRWKDFERAIWEEAAALWADLCREGHRISSDHDLLIAVYARQLRATVVTHNVKDFARLGVALLDWVK